MCTVHGHDNAPPRNRLKEHISQFYPKCRILTFGYDASITRAGISTIAGIKEKALQLLDDLIEMREASQSVRAMFYRRY
jgi:hypothetical protein